MIEFWGKDSAIRRTFRSNAEPKNLNFSGKYAIANKIYTADDKEKRYKKFVEKIEAEKQAPQKIKLSIQKVASHDETHDQSPSGYLPASDRHFTSGTHIVKEEITTSSNIEDKFIEKSDGYHLKLDITGYKPHEVEIKTKCGSLGSSVSNFKLHTLEVCGKMTFPRPVKEEYGLIKREFKRSYQLPVNCDVKQTKSEILDDGKILFVSVPYLKV